MYTGPLLQVHRTLTTGTQDHYYRYTESVLQVHRTLRVPRNRHTKFQLNMFSEPSAKSFMALAQADKTRVDLFMNKEGKVGLRRVNQSDPVVSFPFSIASELLLFNVHRNHKVYQGRGEGGEEVGER